MTRWQQMVRDFNLVANTPRGDTPEIRAAELRYKLIWEEALETVHAIQAGDLVESVDGLCDLIYVALGAADAFGVDLEPIFEEIHRTNMMKLQHPGVGGKIPKPEGWKPPRIAELLEEQRKR